MSKIRSLKSITVKQYRKMLDDLQKENTAKIGDIRAGIEYRIAELVIRKSACSPDALVAMMVVNPPVRCGATDTLMAIHAKNPTDHEPMPMPRESKWIIIRHGEYQTWSSEEWLDGRPEHELLAILDAVIKQKKAQS